MKLPPLKGGMEKHIQSLTLWQLEHKNKVCIYFNEGETVSSNDVKILPQKKLYKIKPQAIGILMFYSAIIIRLVRHRDTFDVVHIHGDWSSLLFVRFLKYLVNSKLIAFTIHGQITKKFTHQKLFPRLLKSVDLIFSTGYEAANEITYLTKKNVFVQPSGVKQVFFQDFHRQFNSRMKRVVTVANLMPKKNIELVLEIAKELRDVEFCIIGDGLEKNKLLSKIDNEQINNVKLLGFKSPGEVFDVYIKSDCFLLTSLAEGTPTSMMEAIVTGLPIVVSNAGAIDNLVKDGEHGYVIKSMRKEDYMDKLKKILNDSELTQKMSQKNKLLGESFSWDCVAKRITTLTKGALDARK